MNGHKSLVGEGVEEAGEMKQIKTVKEVWRTDSSEDDRRVVWKKVMMEGFKIILKF